MAYLAVLLNPASTGTSGRKIQATRWEENEDVVEFRRGHRLVDRIPATHIIAIQRFEHAADADAALVKHRDRKAGAATMSVSEGSVARPVKRKGPGRAAESGSRARVPTEAVAVRISEQGTVGKGK